MLSRSGVYALQATLHLAQRHPGKPVSASRIAASLEVPSEYLAKVLRQLSKEGVLTSARGAYGGYRLAVDPSELTLDRVVRPFDETRPLKRCLLGGPCDLDDPCAVHLRRLEWNAARSRIFEATKLTDLLPDGAHNGAVHGSIDSNNRK